MALVLLQALASMLASFYMRWAAKARLEEFALNRATLPFKYRLELRRSIEMSSIFLPSSVVHSIVSAVTVVSLILLTDYFGNHGLGPEAISLYQTYTALVPQLISTTVHPCLCLWQLKKLNNSVFGAKFDGQGVLFYRRSTGLEKLNAADAHLNAVNRHWDQIKQKSVQKQKYKTHSNMLPSTSGNAGKAERINPEYSYSIDTIEEISL